jgi:hypothetical protein
LLLEDTEINLERTVQKAKEDKVIGDVKILELALKD